MFNCCDPHLDLRSPRHILRVDIQDRRRRPQRVLHKLGQIMVIANPIDDSPQADGIRVERTQGGRVRHQPLFQLDAVLLQVELHVGVGFVDDALEVADDRGDLLGEVLGAVAVGVGNLEVEGDICGVGLADGVVDLGADFFLRSLRLEEGLFQGAGRGRVEALLHFDHLGAVEGLFPVLSFRLVLLLGFGESAKRLEHFHFVALRGFFAGFAALLGLGDVGKAVGSNLLSLVRKGNGVASNNVMHSQEGAEVRSKGSKGRKRGVSCCLKLVIRCPVATQLVTALSLLALESLHGRTNKLLHSATIVALDLSALLEKVSDDLEIWLTS